MSSELLQVIFKHRVYSRKDFYEAMELLEDFIRKMSKDHILTYASIKVKFSFTEEIN